MNNNLSRNNHFVAQMYLDAWKNENNKVWTYDLLVPNEKCNIWNERSTKSIASQQDFYIRLNEDTEVDDIEQYLNNQFETPASIPMKKAVNGEKLLQEEWEKIISYIGCQIVRTPAFVSKMLEISKMNIVNTFKQAIQNIEEELNSKSIEIIIQDSKKEKNNSKNDLFPLKIVDTGLEHGDKKIMKIETITGKSYYLCMLMHLLTETIKVLHNHEWKIIDIDERVKIPTSDDPVICLNYYNDKKYDFGGGWNKTGSEIIFPISPTKIIYTKVGEKNINFRPDYQLSMLIKRIIVEHASRRIFSKDKEKWIIKSRKRHVNKSEFEREKEMLKNWHKNYIDMESEYLKHKIIH